jgi:hypothetical protein
VTDEPRIGSPQWVAASVGEATWRWAAVSAFVLVMALTRGLTLPPTLVVCAAGTVMWAIGRYSPQPARPDVGDVAVGGLVLWAALFVILCLWELAAFLLGNDEAHPTFSMLADPVLSFPPTRALAGFGWLAWGWYLLSR